MFTKVAFLLLVIGALVSALSLNNAYFKHVQGPPEEFDLHKLPRPEESALTSDSVMFSINLSEQAGKYVWDADLPVDSTTQFSFSIMSRVKKLRVTISKEGNAIVSPRKVESWFGWNHEDSVPSTTYIVDAPVPGLYTVRVECSEKPTSGIQAILFNQSPHKIYAHLAGDYKSLVLNQELYLQTRLFDANQNSNSSYSALRSSYMTADIDVRLPNGEEKTIAMHDDGLHSDGEANDGVFGGSFTATQEGPYATKIVMRGVTPDGALFMRSTQHLFTVVENDGFEAVSASASVNPHDEMIKLLLLVKCDAAKREHVIGQKFRVYSEVHGRGAQGTVPVAFVAGMSIVQPSKVKVSEATVGNEQQLLQLELQLSLKWLSRAQATLPLQLKNIYVQDAQNNIPVLEVEQLEVENVQLEDENKQLSLVFANDLQRNREAFVQAMVSSLTESRFKFNGIITEEMKVGKRPQKYQKVVKEEFKNNSTTSNSGKLLLVHGYCAPETPWQLSDFTDFAEFQDFKQSRTHDEFALLIQDFAEQFPSFSIAAHSQGGCAAQHLLAFYWSKLDTQVDEDARLIQSVGTPYTGNSLAGSMAGLGESLGVGCGENYDLSVDGAKLWIASIPLEARKHVYYYTSQYKDWSWCNLAANLVLSFPNDGVAEYKYTQWEGANNMGHTKSQCHSVDMKYPPQCKDSQRNAVINAKAAR